MVFIGHYGVCKVSYFCFNKLGALDIHKTNGFDSYYNRIRVSNLCSTVQKCTVIASVLMIL